MKYKVGDEVLVKAKIIAGSRRYFGVEIEGNCFDVCETNIITAPDMTAEETWEIARRIVGCHEHGLEETKRREIFSRDDAFDVFNLFTEHEAKAKIEAWEAEKDIKVGDEVALKADPDNNEYKFFVTYVDNGLKTIGGFSSFDGEAFSRREIRRYQKTGRHIDIKGLLNQIRGNE